MKPTQKEYEAAREAVRKATGGRTYNLLSLESLAISMREYAAEQVRLNELHCGSCGDAIESGVNIICEHCCRCLDEN